MTVFENFKSKNIDELAEWLDKHCEFDTAPWWRFWDKNYCNKCEPEIAYITNPNKDIDSDIELECAWCELHHKCKFFQEMNDIPDIKQTIKMWLMSECE